MEQSVDVDYRRTVEWIYERRKLPADWNQRLRAIAIRQKDLLKAIEEAPELHIRQIAAGDLTGYLQARAIVQQLESSPEAAKGRTLLGNWQSSHLHNWTRLTQLYEKDNLFLADCGKVLLQLGQYDLLALKQQQNQCEKQLQDDSQRQIALLESAERTKKQFRDQCQKLGIEGVRPRVELKALTRKLPVIYREIHEIVLGSDLAAVIAQYREVTKSNHRSTISLPAIEEMQKIGPIAVDIAALQDQYAPVVAISAEIEAEIAEIPEAGKEWTIEMVGSGVGGSETTVQDFPYASRTLRNRLLTDFEELAAFCEVRRIPHQCVSEVLKRVKEAQTLLLMREQPSVIDSIVVKLEELQKDRVSGQLASLRKVAEETRASVRQTQTQMKTIRESCRKLIATLQEGVSRLFPGIRFRIIGDLLRDLQQKD